MGDEPVVIEFESDEAKVEVTARPENRTLVIQGRHSEPTSGGD
jgi:hypothetical protein